MNYYSFFPRILLCTCFSFLVFTSISAQFFEFPFAVTEELNGDFLVSDLDKLGIYRIDRFDGTISVVSDASRGNGPVFTSPTDIAIEEDGNIIVTDFDPAVIYRVDPNTGDRTVVASSYSPGEGASLANCSEVEIAANGDLIILSPNQADIFRINPVTGYRTIIANNNTGSGVDLSGGFLVGLAIEKDGSLIAVRDAIVKSIIRIDPMTKERTIVSDLKVDSLGPNIIDPVGLTVASNGDLYVSSLETEDVFRVNPITGERSRLRPCGGANTTFGAFYSLEWLNDGSLITSDSDNKQFVRINLESENCTVVTTTGFTSASKEPEIAAYALAQNQPNPFQNSTVITYDIFVSGQVDMKVFNIFGQPVRQLVNGHMIEGNYTMDWDGNDDRGQKLPSGVYFLQLNGQGFNGTLSMILSR